MTESLRTLSLGAEVPHVVLKKFILASVLCLSYFALAAQQVTSDGNSTSIDGKVQLSETVHDFGDVLVSDGELSCVFTVTNISSEPLIIYTVASSCGCTKVNWTKEPISEGGTGRIEATYNNSDGPYPFDKTLTVYFSSQKKPVILHMRGVAHQKQQALKDLYPIHFGVLAFKEAEVKCGNMNMGSQRSDKITVANLSKSQVKISFENVSSGLSLTADPEIILPGSTAKISYTITPGDGMWGKNYFYFTPLVFGKATPGVDSRSGDSVEQIGIWAFVKEDFSPLSKEEIKSGSQPIFSTSTYDFGSVKAGTKVEASYSLTNTGKRPFLIHKADADWAKVCAKEFPELAPGKKGTFTISVDTTGMPEGDALVVVTLTTNSPSRPIVNLFVVGTITS